MLFKIDPTPYQAEFDLAKAALSEAEETLKQLREQVNMADANVKRIAAALDLNVKTENRMRDLVASGSIAQQRYDDAYSRLKQAQEDYSEAQSNFIQARIALSTQSAIIGESQARLDKAKFNLDSTVVRAPTDGYAVQVRLRPGMMAVPLPLKPVLTFVSYEDAYLVGAFKQNPLQNIKVGNAAEVIFPAIPGRAFRGKVTKILDTLGQGQLQPGGELMKLEEELPAGRVPVFIELVDDMSAYELPLGSAARVAIYSEEMEFLAPIRQILLRMMSWKNIVCFEAL